MAFHILVLAGGSGTRLWPLSRESLPKHLLPLGPQGESLLRATVDRVAPLADAVHVVTARDQLAGCATALGSGAATHLSVIAEPAPRGTGPALGLAVHQIAAADPDALIVSVHADHHVSDVSAYRAAILAAAGWAAASGGLATVGLHPTHPATGLGYIEVGEPQPPGAWVAPGAADADPVLLAAAAALPAAHAAAFVEKPSYERARAFLAGDRHLWNLGLFAWTAGAFLGELNRAAPALDSTLREVVEESAAGHQERAAELYSALPTQAVEPLLLEGSARLTVVRAGFEWSDLGSWSDLLAAGAAHADADGNVAVGDTLLVDAHDCLVESRGGRAVVVMGVDGLVVVDTGDSLLVMPANASQRVREVVDRLRAAGRLEIL
ncbi:MAG TPA: sugar phosphate nucleotidyltransferase [Candidatus Dormibacteraeota bacterium]|nr:sugar phosphate nucleotidyltransferase [Candidatus Dormibacteraeota bacterium]